MAISYKHNGHIRFGSLKAEWTSFATFLALIAKNWRDLPLWLHAAGLVVSAIDLFFLTLYTMAYFGVRTPFSFSYQQHQDEPERIQSEEKQFQIREARQATDETNIDSFSREYHQYYHLERPQSPPYYPRGISSALRNPRSWYMPSDKTWIDFLDDLFSDLPIIIISMIVTILVDDLFGLFPLALSFVKIMKHILQFIVNIFLPPDPTGVAPVPHHHHHSRHYTFAMSGHSSSSTPANALPTASYI
eukprot:GEZU01003391.1.p1 GENE.GEZU01003391.1~~GEZU01003391.1.p1  ORF type:complete len:246 (+),score=45.43 GEZU01003391.1:776-1513(+)